MLSRDSAYFQELQTQTGWGRTLSGFAAWCSPKPGWSTLDVGCGPGLLPVIFSKFGCRAIGVDLDLEMFRPSPLHPNVVVADVFDLPFKSQSFDLITASNLVFMLSEPMKALVEIKKLVCPAGRVAMLNPSEHLNEQAASIFIKEKGLDGLARDTLLNWARRAAENYHWTEDETHTLYRDAGLKYMGSIVKVGPGFGRFSWGIA
jgi:ubiquinone/menaquinone biosynthesis C-methylase UbiE